jgi:hypothetical protein
MSFSKTVSVCAALASIFAAGATGWKLAQDDNSTKSPQLEEKVQELEKQLAETKQLSPVPAPVSLPSAAPEPVPQTVTPPPPPLPPLPGS